MIIRIKADDLISIVIGESNTASRSETIEYRRVNTLRNMLRLKGIISDLELRDFNTLHTFFPDNITIERTYMVITKTERFVSHYKCRFSKYDENERDELINMWRETK